LELDNLVVDFLMLMILMMLLMLQNYIDQQLVHLKILNHHTNKQDLLYLNKESFEKAH
jgi:hypothetical protein